MIYRSESVLLLAQEILLHISLIDPVYYFALVQVITHLVVSALLIVQCKANTQMIRLGLVSIHAQ